MADELTRISEHTWFFPADADRSKVQPNVGVIATGTQTIVIDAGNSPRHARRVLRALADANLPPASYVVYTHHHWDHVFGGQAFGAPIIAHEHCRDILSERATRPWSNAYLDEEMRKNPEMEIVYVPMQRAIDDWHSFHIALPSLTFTRYLALYLDGVTVEFEHIGGEHAEEAIVARVASEGVAFVGDGYYPAPVIPRPPNPRYDQTVIERLLADESIQMIVDGHTLEPVTREKLAALLDGR